MNKYPNKLIEFTKNRKGQLTGVVVATNRGRLGWSLCAPADKFDKEKALMIAFKRADVGSTVKIPHSISSVHTRMTERAERYFKPIINA